MRQYEKLSAFRLINEVSVSREAEETMLDMLKRKYGVEQVARLKQMLLDVDLSEQLIYEMKK